MGEDSSVGCIMDVEANGRRFDPRWSEAELEKFADDIRSYLFAKSATNLLQEKINDVNRWYIDKKCA
ncbi:unnamed protein product [Brachionus calyciflorus]|uniref:Uncharacterized protein n=1 Tax=Brachionus calyciflorus TaxID=104777 RepID=A0A814G609_9BILA|nr:unnamed protein product [Brachionus calyciflorus]